MDNNCLYYQDYLKTKSVYIYIYIYAYHTHAYQNAFNRGYIKY